MKLAGLPRKDRISACEISPDNRQLFVSLDDRVGTPTLGTVPLTPTGNFDAWGTLPECLEVFSVAWAPSGEETVVLVARLQYGDPPVFETTIFTWTKGQQPLQRHTLSQERNPRSKKGRSVTLTWPRPEVVCLTRIGGLDLLDLASGKSRQLYEPEDPKQLITALRSCEEGVLEFILTSAEALLEPEKAQPQLVRLGLDGRILRTAKLAAGIGADGAILSDALYVYGGLNTFEAESAGRHAIRVFSREANRLIHRLPLDLSSIGTPRTDRVALVSPVALSRDGSLMVCVACPAARALEKGADTIVFKLAPP